MLMSMDELQTKTEHYGKNESVAWRDPYEGRKAVMDKIEIKTSMERDRHMLDGY